MIQYYKEESLFNCINGSCRYFSVLSTFQVVFFLHYYNPVLGLYSCNDSFSFAKTGPLPREIRSSRLIKAIHNDAVTRFVRA